MHGFSSPFILVRTIISEPEEQGKHARKGVASPEEHWKEITCFGGGSPSKAGRSALPFALLTAGALYTPTALPASVENIEGMG